MLNYGYPAAEADVLLCSTYRCYIVHPSTANVVTIAQYCPATGKVTAGLRQRLNSTRGLTK